MDWNSRNRGPDLVTAPCPTLQEMTWENRDLPVEQELRSLSKDHKEPEVRQTGNSLVSVWKQHSTRERDTGKRKRVGSGGLLRDLQKVLAEDSAHRAPHLEAKISLKPCTDSTAGPTVLSTSPRLLVDVRKISVYFILFVFFFICCLWFVSIPFLFLLFFFFLIFWLYLSSFLLSSVYLSNRNLFSYVWIIFLFFLVNFNNPTFTPLFILFCALL